MPDPQASLTLGGDRVQHERSKCMKVRFVRIATMLGMIAALAAVTGAGFKWD